jgi:hypothetical protein
MDHTKFTLRFADWCSTPCGSPAGDRGDRRHDADLAGRLGARDVDPLNVAEGMDAPGGTRLLRFRTALGSTNEVIACLDVAAALGYVDVDAKALDAVQHVRAVLINLVKRKRHARRARARRAHSKPA